MRATIAKSQSGHVVKQHLAQRVVVVLGVVAERHVEQLAAVALEQQVVGQLGRADAHRFAARAATLESRVGS